MEDTKELEIIIRSLLLSTNKVLTANALLRDVEDTEGRSINFRKLGFESFIDYLSSIPHVVKVDSRSSRYNPDVLPVASSSSKHIDQLVSRQRVTAPKRSNASRRGGYNGRPIRPPPRRRYSALPPPPETATRNPPTTRNQPAPRNTPAPVPLMAVAIDAESLERKYRETYHNTYRSVNGYSSNHDYQKPTPQVPSRPNEPFAARTSDHYAAEAYDTCERTSDAYERTSDAYERTSDAYERTSDAYERSSDAYERTSDAYEGTCNAYEKITSDSYASKSSDSYAASNADYCEESYSNEAYHIPDVCKDENALRNYYKDTYESDNCKGKSYEGAWTNGLEDLPEEELYNYTMSVCNPRKSERQEYEESRADDEFQDDDEESFISPNMKQNLRRLIEKYSGGIMSTELPAKYLQEFGVPLDIGELGFMSAIQLASSLPSVFTYRREWEHDWTLYDARVVPQIDDDQDDSHKKTKNIPESVIDNIKILVEKHPTGIRSTRLVDMYKEEFRKVLDLKILGCEKMEDLLDSVREVVTTVHSVAGGYYLLLPKHQVIPLEVTLQLQAKRAADDEHMKLAAATYTWPEDVFQLGLKIPFEKLPDINSDPDEPLLEMAIRVMEIVSPGCFYFMISSKHNKLESFMDDLDKLYKDAEESYKIPVPVLAKGLYCACQYGGEWHRALIKGFKEQRVEVEYIDYGTPATVNKSELRFLHIDFAKLPVQAHCAKLCGIKPPRGEKRWPSETCQQFLKMVEDKALVACVYNVEEKKGVPRLEMVLYDTNGPREVIINELLVDRKLAELCDINQVAETVPETVQEPNPARCSPVQAPPAQSSSTSDQHEQPAWPPRVPPGFEGHEPLTIDSLSYLTVPQPPQLVTVVHPPVYQGPPVQRPSYATPYVNHPQQAYVDMLRTEDMFRRLLACQTPSPSGYFLLPQVQAPAYHQVQNPLHFDYNFNTSNIPQSHLSQSKPYNMSSAVPIPYMNSYQQAVMSGSPSFLNSLSPQQSCFVVSPQSSRPQSRNTGSPHQRATSASPSVTASPVGTPRDTRSPNFASASHRDTRSPNFASALSSPYKEMQHLANTLSENVDCSCPVTPLSQSPPVTASVSVESPDIYSSQWGSDDKLNSPSDDDYLSAAGDMDVSELQVLGENEEISDLEVVAVVPDVGNSEVDSTTAIEQVVNTSTDDETPLNWEELDIDDTPSKAENFSVDFRDPSFVNELLKLSEVKIQNIHNAESNLTSVNWKDVFNPDVNIKSKKDGKKPASVLKEVDMRKALVQQLEIANVVFHVICVYDKLAVLAHEFYPQVTSLNLLTVTKIMEIRNKNFTSISKKDHPNLFSELDKVQFNPNIDRKKMFRLGRVSITYLTEIPEMFSTLKLVGQEHKNMLSNIEKILEEFRGN